MESEEWIECYECGSPMKEKDGTRCSKCIEEDKMFEEAATVSEPGLAAGYVEIQAIQDLLDEKLTYDHIKEYLKLDGFDEATLSSTLHRVRKLVRSLIST